MALITTYPRLAEFKKAQEILENKKIPYTLVEPGPGYTLVGVPSIIIDEEDRRVFSQQGLDTAIASGWVEYREPKGGVPATAPVSYENDVFGNVSVMVLQPCMADTAKLRGVIHLSGNLSELFPYMNTIRRDAFYNVNGPTFTFMDNYRMITLYPQRIAMAKADDIVDVWRVLEELRVGFNECWKNRAGIEPSYELRKKPAALQIYFRLPKTNCGQCGEKACMAFALKLWSGLIPLSLCKPVFSGTHTHLKDALVEICAGFDVKKE